VGCRSVKIRGLDAGSGKYCVDRCLSVCLSVYLLVNISRCNSSCDSCDLYS